MHVQVYRTELKYASHAWTSGGGGPLRRQYSPFRRKNEPYFGLRRLVIPGADRLIHHGPMSTLILGYFEPRFSLGSSALSSVKALGLTALPVPALLTM